MDRRFELIDGNIVKSYKLCGYCTRKHGGLTEKLIKTHNCKRKVNGEPCPRLELFNYTEGLSKQLKHS